MINLPFNLVANLFSHNFGDNFYDKISLIDRRTNARSNQHRKL